MDHPIELTLKEIIQETSDINNYIFECTNDSQFTWQPGQYLDYYIKHDNPDDRSEYRWITIASAPSENIIMLSTRFAEKSSTFKQKLSTLQPGDVVYGKGPMGSFTLPEVQKPTVMIAGGIGITPFRAILTDLASRLALHDVRLIYGNRSDDNVPFRSTLDSLVANNPGLTVDYVYGQHIDAELVKTLVGDISSVNYMISGLEKMVASIKQSLLDAGVLEESIKTDDFDGYDNDSATPIFS